MKEECNKNLAGLTTGIFAAGLHALWVILVLLGVGQTYLDLIFPLHFVGNVYLVLPFSAGTAAVLVVLAFVGGYVLGWLFTALWNALATKVK